MKRILSLLIVVSLMIFALAGCGGQEQSGDKGEGENGQLAQWPTREVRTIIPYSEGGASHRTAMLVKKVVDENDLLSEPIIVNCITGANTINGQKEVLNAEPDGHTLLAHHNAMLNANALDQYDFNYDDFKQVAQVWKSPILLVTNKDAPYDNFEELVEYVEKRDEPIKWGFVHVGGNTHFSSSLLFDNSPLELGGNVEPVMAGSGSEMAKYLAGGMCDAAIQLPASCAEYVKSGDFKVLAHSGEGNLSIYGNEVKSFQEQGADFTYFLRFLYHAPKDTPDKVVSQIEDVLKEVVNSETFQERMKQEMCTPEFLPSDEARKAFAKENENAQAIGKKVKAGMDKLKE